MTATDPPRNSTPLSNLVVLVTAVRWGTTTLGLLWSALLGPDLDAALFGAVLLAYALFRTIRPLDYSRRGWRSLVSILVELMLSLAAIVGTDCWDSPYIFVLFTPVIAAGFERGLWHSLRVAVTGVVAIGLAAWALDIRSGLNPITTWGAELVLVACVASYGRHLRDRAEQAAAVNLTQLTRLNQANAMLVGLNQLAHDMPVSFDLKETIESAVVDVHTTVQADVTALLLLDHITNSWAVAHVRGVRLPGKYDDSDMPPAISELARDTQVHLVGPLTPERHGLSRESAVGIYAPLWSGSTQVGLLAVEATTPDKLNNAQLSAVTGLAEQVALTVDNARWFEKLQARGAMQERTRIARDLHDRIGQSVAYIAFELDRLCERAAETPVYDDMQRLRDDTRKIVGELRETLYDLRTDVSEQHSLIVTINEFLARVEKRSGLSVSFEHHETHRLPNAQEREVWRIAQEAIVNTERHAGATRVGVTWERDKHHGRLVISDDGYGIGSPTADDHPSYGITGMRERAGLIGAKLDIRAAQPRGTVVSLTIGVNTDELLGNSEKEQRVRT